MANNRMFLCHRPSGLAVYLGKRMAGGWYDVPESLYHHVLQFFRELTDVDGGPDDVCIAMENASEAPGALEYDGMGAGPDSAPALIRLSGLRVPFPRLATGDPLFGAKYGIGAEGVAKLAAVQELEDDYRSHATRTMGGYIDPGPYNYHNYDAAAPFTEGAGI